MLWHYGYLVGSFLNYEVMASLMIGFFMPIMV